jgi:hypothetical protein
LGFVVVFKAQQASLFPASGNKLFSPSLSPVI